jgi:hypothetical protein
MLYFEVILNTIYELLQSQEPGPPLDCCLDVKTDLPKVKQDVAE